GNGAAVRRLPEWRFGFYFLAVGLGFMFVEIAFIQKFILFLSHPLYAVAVVLCAFLCFAGLGSRYSQLMPARGGDHRGRRQAALAVSGIFLAVTVFLWAHPT